MAKTSTSKLWKMKDILSYAASYYHLKDRLEADGDNWRRKITRTLSDSGYRKTNHGYELTEKQARDLIEYDLYDYFFERMPKRYRQDVGVVHDIREQIEYEFEHRGEIQDATYFEDDNPVYEYVFNDFDGKRHEEICLMLEAIIARLYASDNIIFDRASFRSDYRERDMIADQLQFDELDERLRVKHEKLEIRLGDYSNYLVKINSQSSSQI